MIRRIALGPGFNWRLILPVLAAVLAALAVGMLVCAGYSLAIGDGAAHAFALPAAVLVPLAGAGTLLSRRARNVPFRSRDGYLAVTLAWIVAAAAGAAPFVLEGTLPRAVDGLFESMAGFTTTGSSLMDVEQVPDSVLLWRSLTQWLGGVGIVVLVVAIAPAAGVGSQRLFHAETSGVTQDRLTPRIADTAKIICSIYVGLTVAGFAAFFAAGMGPFDAFNHILTTISSGGYSTRSASIGAFDSLPIELVAIVFMVASGINFAFYWRVLRGGSIWPQAAEVRAFALILLAATVVVTTSLVIAGHDGGFWGALRGGGFTVASIGSGTGLVTDDYDRWNDFARSQLLVLMFIGGCAGSTSGGIKVVRLLLLWKTVGQELQRQLRPRAVQVLRTRGRVFSEDVRRAVLAFALIYGLVALAGTFALLITGVDAVSALTSSVSCLALLGTGFGTVGPTENFSSLSESARCILMFLMLAGRLEVLTVLVLLTPAFWRRNVA
ncbi:Trk system potassium uptake protein TrkH [Paraconexibacter sp. AEG42_29]|uniref:Trk system potassium uptake protein TrkH n=1 Tax=Paraconexibacter sp. AEG42_29 TaxID=2997339 RepID=A0AAU7ARG7_9ACTN